MARNPDRKRETQQKMVDAATRLFRRNGYDGIGVAGVAQEAGVTSGAFYDHFGSKEGAFAAAIGAGLDEVIEGVPRFQAEHGKGWVAAFAEYYLGAAHRGDADRLCAMTALSPDVARAGPEIKAAYDEKMGRIVDLIAQGLDGPTAPDRRRRAWQLLSTLIGGLTLARATGSPERAAEIAADVIAAARRDPVL